MANKSQAIMDKLKHKS